jgi:probable HAF family extracellular repeat protein
VQSVPTGDVGPNITANAIYNDGLIAGNTELDGDLWFYSHPNQVQQPFTYTKGQQIVTPLGSSLNLTPDSNSAFANSINDTGQAVGVITGTPFIGFLKQNPGASNSVPNQLAYLYSNGTVTDLGSLGGGGSDALAINNTGNIVGYSYTASGAQHAFLYANGTMIDLGALTSGGSSHANAINNEGEIVGEATVANGNEDAFLYINGSMIDLNNLLPADSGWVLQDATDINNLGVIVGNGLFDGEERAFILDTTPEAPTLALLGLGIVGLGLLQRKWRRHSS